MLIVSAYGYNGAGDCESHALVRGPTVEEVWGSH
jgi:hypothetical protein